MTKRIIKNSVKCLKCLDVIESKHRHDFVWCKCKSIAVDGGKEYLKRCGNLGTYEELSKMRQRAPRGWRTLKIESREWTYRVSRDNVTFRDEHDCLVANVDILVLTGRSGDTIERGRRKETSDGMVTPGQVAKYVGEHMKTQLFDYRY